jgi:hypothetical protein
VNTGGINLNGYHHHYYSLLHVLSLKTVLVAESVNVLLEDNLDMMAACWHISP